MLTSLRSVHRFFTLWILPSLNHGLLCCSLHHSIRRVVISVIVCTSSSKYYCVPCYPLFFLFVFRLSTTFAVSFTPRSWAAEFHRLVTRTYRSITPHHVIYCLNKFRCQVSHWLSGTVCSASPEHCRFNSAADLEFFLHNPLLGQ